METINVLEKITQDTDLNITHIRKYVLDILLSEKKPMTAYEILDKLKVLRPNAEPPTVYRALTYLVDKKLAHRIESSNQYVCCSHLNEFKIKYHGLLFICHNCNQAFEYLEDSVKKFIDALSKKHGFLIDDTLIEIKGVCPACVSCK